MKNYIKEQLEESQNVISNILKNHEFLEKIRSAAEACIHTFENRGKIFLAGNGGSAADAQHIAAEFVSRFNFDRPGLPAIALTTDTSILTAIGNDYGFEKIFSRQLEANSQKGDIFIAYTTSGKSKNILGALETAKLKGLTTICLTGENRKLVEEWSDYCIDVPSNSTPKIQEAHAIIGHIICGYVELEFFRKPEHNA